MNIYQNCGENMRNIYIYFIKLFVNNNLNLIMNALKHIFNPELSLEWCLNNNEDPDEIEVMMLKHELISAMITALQKDW